MSSSAKTVSSTTFASTSAEALPTLATNTLHRLQEWIGNHEQPDDMTLLLARQL